MVKATASRQEKDAANIYMKAWAARHREQRHAYLKEWHKAHPGYETARNREQRALRQAFVDAAHAGGCVDCGTKDFRVLQSDHVRGIKVGRLSALVAKTVPLRVLFAELDKCETRCANCHTIVTVERRKAKSS